MNFAVIGANYGDEGKGLVTDALADRLGGDCRVVRFNGGAQAAHTVVTDEHVHVFSHVGSGTFTGAATHLSRYFVANPILFNQEIIEIEAAGFTPAITIDPRAKISTPFDMALNQFRESMRGKGRHGSCGIGFGDTIARCEAGHTLTAWDLANSDVRHIVEGMLDWFHDCIAEVRKEAGGEDFRICDMPVEKIIDDGGVLNHFLEDCREMALRIQLLDDAGIADMPVIFEGAQGLRLDMDRGRFPHVTRSNTGMKNVEALCALAGIDAVSALYVSRAYLTRHGAGPLKDEMDLSQWFDIDDPTNIPNPWQGSMRFAPIDPELMLLGILRDRTPVMESRAIVFTCLDQVYEDTIPVSHRDAIEKVSSGELFSYIDRTSSSEMGGSFGPKRETLFLPDDFHHAKFA